MLHGRVCCVRARKNTSDTQQKRVTNEIFVTEWIWTLMLTFFGFDVFDVLVGTFWWETEVHVRVVPRMCVRLRVLAHGDVR